MRCNSAQRWRLPVRVAVSGLHGVPSHQCGNSEMNGSEAGPLPSMKQETSVGDGAEGARGSEGHAPHLRRALEQHRSARNGARRPDGGVRGWGGQQPRRRASGVNLAGNEIGRLLHGGDLLRALLVQLQGRGRAGGTERDRRGRWRAHTGQGHASCAQQARPPRTWISNFSSRAIMISTVSRESAPRSTNLDSAATWRAQRGEASRQLATGGAAAAPERAEPGRPPSSRPLGTPQVVSAAGQGRGLAARPTLLTSSSSLPSCSAMMERTPSRTSVLFCNHGGGGGGRGGWVRRVPSRQ